MKLFSDYLILSRKVTNSSSNFMFFDEVFILKKSLFLSTNIFSA